jgi:hypothetical protein
LWAIAEGLELLQLFEGASVGAALGAFVAEHQVEAGLVGEVVEGPGKAVFWSGLVVAVFELSIHVDGHAVHFVGEDGGLDGGDAAEAPAGGGHGFDEFGFEEAGGGELG